MADWLLEVAMAFSFVCAAILLILVCRHPGLRG